MQCQKLKKLTVNCLSAKSSRSLSDFDTRSVSFLYIALLCMANMKYSLELLKQEFDPAKTDFLFFWGHTPKIPGVVDKSCLSQWFPASFVVNDVRYATAEHWMMARKAALFYDMDAYEKILQSEKPGVAKAIGREVQNFDAQTWNNKAYQFVVEGSIHKFSQNEALRVFLVQTGRKVIVEASPTDRIWGIGMGPDDNKINDPSKWKGTNWLGFALMEARDFLNK
jgi:ribA/ribD-fused uncharacterized protein